MSAETAAVLEDASSLNEKSAQQLLKLIKYLRKEKDLSISKFDMIRAENVRLKAQLEIIQKQFEETKETLNKERQSSDSNLLSSSKQSELLRKVRNNFEIIKFFRIFYI